MIKKLLILFVILVMGFSNIFVDIEKGLNETIGQDKRGHFRLGVYQTVIYRDLLHLSKEDTIKLNLATGILKGVYDYYNGGCVEILDLASQLVGMGFKLSCEMIGGE